MASGKSSAFWDRVVGSIEESRRQLSGFREARRTHLEQYVGPYYGAGGSADKVPVNRIEEMVSTYSRQLAGGEPAAFCQCRNRRFKPTAASLEAALNDLLKEIVLRETLQEAILDAIFVIGVVKVGVAEGEAFRDRNGETVIRGVPFAECVDLDDWVHDMSARKIRNAEFMGNRYYLPLEQVNESRLFGSRKLTAVERPTTDDYGIELTSTLGHSQSEIDYGEFEEVVELWDVWLPRDRCIATFEGRSEGGENIIADKEPLRVLEWQGPRTGPFHILRFQTVPNNSMPLSPIHTLYDLHLADNLLWRKLIRQAARLKTILGVKAGSTEDGRRILETNDGEAIRLDDPAAAKEFTTGGVHPELLAFAMQVGQQFNKRAGNLDLLAGLAAQSPTATQDEMLGSAANERIDEMKSRVYRFTQDIIESLAYWTWNDPYLNRPVTKRIAGTQFSYMGRLTAQSLMGELSDYQIGVSPYSLQQPTPMQQLSAIYSTIERVVMPLMPIMQAQGLSIDVRALIRTVSRYHNIPELADIILSLGPSEIEMAQQQAASGRSGDQGQRPPTTRRYERVSRAATVPHAQQNLLTRALMGGKLQPKEAQAAAGG